VLLSLKRRQSRFLEEKGNASHAGQPVSEGKAAHGSSSGSGAIRARIQSKQNEHAPLSEDAEKIWKLQNSKQVKRRWRMIALGKRDI
jgi:ABC-type molybdate transport system substrate-binding protein